MKEGEYFGRGNGGVWRRCHYKRRGCVPKRELLGARHPPALRATPFKGGERGRRGDREGGKRERREGWVGNGVGGWGILWGWSRYLSRLLLRIYRLRR